MVVLALALLAAAQPGDCAMVSLRSFTDVTVWKANADGGNAPALWADTEFTHDGGGMRLRYTSKPPEWGNLTGPCQVPPEAAALRLWVYRHAASGGAAMHMWLLESDGDAWSQQMLFGDRSLADAEVGWDEVRMPIGAFTFQPRGTGTRQMTPVNRMLIGCNYGDLDVTVSDMAWETEAEGAPIQLPRTDGLTLETGPRGGVGALTMEGGFADGHVTAEAPGALAAAAREAGFGATLLQAGDLADLPVLTPARLGAVILPYGLHFPRGPALRWWPTSGLAGASCRWVDTPSAASTT